MLGLLVLKLMVGSLIGIGVLAWRLLAVAGILLKNGISGIIWIIKRLKEMVIKNERKATGKIVLYQVASATASPKYVVLLLFSKKSVFLKIKVAVFLYMFYC